MTVTDSSGEPTTFRPPDLLAAIAQGTDDVVNAALVDLAGAIVEDALGEDAGEGIIDASDRLAELNVRPEAWERAFRVAAGESSPG